MSMELNLKEFLEELIQEVEKELDEATATGNVAGYNVPGAFSDGGAKDKKRKKKISTQFGMKIVGKMDEASIKGRNNKTGESFGMVIGSDKKNKEGEFEVTIRISYSSRISSYKFMFDKGSNLIAIKDYGYSMDGKFPDMKGGGSVKSIRPNGRETIIQIAKITSPAFAKKIVQHVKKVNESVNEAKYYITRNKGRGRGKSLVGGYDLKRDKKLPPKEFRTFKDAEKEVKRLQDMEKGIPGGGSAYFVTDKKMNRLKESINEAKVKRPVNRWLELKNDETMHPHKKMAMGLKELKYQLRETEKFFNWYNKIKTMNELDSNQYWKRTNSHIYKIKERLINIARTIQEIEK